MTLYCITLEEAAKMNEEYCANLFPNRYIRANRYAKREDRLRSIGAGVLLHGVLNINENDILTNPYGKPYLANKDVFFNISHSGNFAVLGVHNTPIGVDIERMDEKNIGVSSKVFTADENKWIKEDTLYRFHVLWTLKESMLKAIGKEFIIKCCFFLSS